MIALFAPSLGGGGAERNMIHLAGGLADRGRKVALIVAQAQGPLRDEVPEDVELVDLGAGRVTRSLVPLARFLRERRPDAVLSTLTHANLIAVAARALSGTSFRLVLREANTLSQTAAQATRIRDRAIPLLVPWLYPRADMVVAVSEGVARDLREKARLTDVRCIPNPAVTPDLERKANEELRHPWFEAGAPPVILAVGSLTPQKDYPTLLEAFRRLRGERECRLLILGEGPERPALARRMEELKLSDDVELRGFVPNPFPFMARAAVLALSSRWEGWPNVCAQALAVGTPVVATDCPHGPREILDNGRFGELVPVGDATALAAGLARAVDLPPQPELLRRRAEEFTLDRTTAAYASVLEGSEP